MNVGKFNAEERALIKSTVAMLTIKRIPDNEIIKNIFDQTNKTISKQALIGIRNRIKRDSYHWSRTMREGEYEYLHEFKERINEILDLQKRHYEIVDSPTEPTTVKQTSMAELHRLSITLSNLFDVAPSIINDRPYQLHHKSREQQQQAKQNLSFNSFDFKILQKPFWVWNQKEHLVLAKESDGQCCWNHIVGLPVKGNPIFDYEKGLFDNLLFSGVNNPANFKFKHKHLWVKKSTGLGVTEFMLRMMAWLCTSTEDNRFKNSKMCIITGPNIEMAIKLIKRLKQIFEPKLGLYFSNKETVLELNGCSIEAYPSNHIDSFRSLDNPKFILLD